MPKQRSHNEWFRKVSLGNRKSCPNCHSKLEDGESIWSWGEYVCGRWNTVTHFCKNCFEKRVKQQLLTHTGSCGCTVNLCVRDDRPNWLTLSLESELCIIK